MPFTEQDAKDMRDAMILLEQKESQQAQAQHQANIGIATAWFNTLGINIQPSTTRTQAKAIFDEIELLLENETDRFRLEVLEGKKIEANTKYKAVKKVNPNS